MPRPVARAPAHHRRVAALHVGPDAPTLGARFVRLHRGVSPQVYPRGRLRRAPAARAARQLFPAALHRFVVRLRVCSAPQEQPSQDPPEGDDRGVQDEPAEELVQREDVHVRQKRLETIPASSGLIHDVHKGDGARERDGRETEAGEEVVPLDRACFRPARRVQRSLRRPDRGDP